MGIVITIYCWLVGQSAAFAARGQIRTRALPWYNIYFLGIFLWVCFLILPLYSYILINYPAWSFLYWYKSADISVFMLTFALLMGCSTVAAGFFFGQKFLDKSTIQISVFSVGIVLLATIILLANEQLFRSFSENSNGTFWDSRLRAIFALAVPVVVANWIFLLIIYNGEGRKMTRGLSQNVADSMASSSVHVKTTVQH